MKIGIISTGSPDYLVDIVADGVIRLIGRENVHLAYSTGVATDIRYTHLMNGFLDRPNIFKIREADALIFSGRSGAEHAKDWMAATGKKTVAVLDGEDDPGIREDLRAVSKIYFKREYLKGRAYPGDVRPLPFAAIPEAPCERVSNIERPVFFMGHYKDLSERMAVGQRLTQMGIPIHDGLVPKADYNRALLGSLVGVSVRGYGWDTYRYWEVPYFGACLLSQRLEIVIPGDFEENREAVFFSDMDEFEKKLRALMDNQARALWISQAGRRACFERHLSTHRAKTVLDAIF